MDQLLTDNIWKEIECLAKESNKKHIAVAYLTDTSKLHLKSNDILVVDASDAAVSSGQTSAAELEELFKTGIWLYSQAGLNAKIYAFDYCVVVGSTNASLSSRNRLIEASILCDEADVVKQSVTFVLQLAGTAAVIDKKFLARISQIPVAQQFANNMGQVEEICESKETDTRLWRLKMPPPARSKNMRAYFLASILSQLGDLTPDQGFILWDGHFGTHLGKSRMTRIYRSRYSLTETGVEYFLPDVSMKQDLIDQFLLAIRTGDANYLPDDLKEKELFSITA